MKIAGLSIEDSKIRAAIVERRFGSTKPIATDEVALPSSPEERNEAFKAALENWKSSHGLDGVVVGLDLSNFSHQTIELPVHDREDIKHALLFEMEKHLPLEPDEYSTDFHTLESSKEGSRNLVLAVRKEKVRWVFDCLSEAGISFLGVKCTALEAASELLSTVNVTDALMVYPTGDIFQLVGLKDSGPEYLKVVKSREAAIAEIEKNLDSYGKSLYVAGESGSLEFDRFAPRTLPLSMPNILASPTSGKGQIKTNFVPEEFSTPKKDYYPYALVLLCVACAVIFISTSVMAYFKDYRAVKKIEAKIEKVKADTREVIGTERTIAAAREKLVFLNEFRYKKNTHIRIIAELSEILPKSAWLTSLSVDEQGKIEIEGFAASAADIIRPLEGSPLFEKVEFSSPVTVKAGTEKFSLKMQLEEANKEDK